MTITNHASTADRRPMTLQDLFQFKRVGDPQISPDGRHVTYTIADVDLEKNSSTSRIWIATTEGKERRLLTNTVDKKDNHARWSPDGKWILFQSNRSGTSQLWAIALSGGEARQLTEINTGASGAIWSPDGKKIAFVSTVYPEFSSKPFKESNALNKKKSEEKEKNPIKAKVHTKLFYRHWDSYVEDKRQHLFVMSFDDGEGGEPRDVTPGDRDAVPNSSTFIMADDYTFSPNSKHLLFTASPEKNEAWNTNFDICRVPITGGSKKWETLTAENKAADSAPLFSADGKQIAWRAQKRPGFESDKWDLYVCACDPDGTLKGEPTNLTGDRDISIYEYLWIDDGFLFTIDEEGHVPIYRLTPPAEGKSGKWKVARQKQLGDGVNGSLSVSASGENLAYFNVRMTRPSEVFVSLDLGKGKNLSHANDELLARLDLPEPESVKIDVEGPTDMQMWILKPPSFDPKKKWPVVYLVHGGPQGAWHDSWSYRWNPEMWAALGYVVAAPNPRGSTGFGQKFMEEISGDWGGKVFEDLMKGADYVESLPYVDKERIATAGASFGGYMMNWFAVQTGRFKTLITHCGVWNFESMYATTEELWFDEWEHGGPPWGKHRESYEKHSPHKYAANLKKFKTPMLIIHNDLDFRVPVSEGQQLFTTLQRMGIPSKFINFPDEGHWVLKPKNSEYWHEQVFSWLKKHVRPGGR